MTTYTSTEPLTKGALSTRAVILTSFVESVRVGANLIRDGCRCASDVDAFSCAERKARISRSRGSPSSHVARITRRDCESIFFPCTTRTPTGKRHLAPVPTTMRFPSDQDLEAWHHERGIDESGDFELSQCAGANACMVPLRDTRFSRLPWSFQSRQGQERAVCQRVSCEAPEDWSYKANWSCSVGVNAPRTVAFLSRFRLYVVKRHAEEAMEGLEGQRL